MSYENSSTTGGRSCRDDRVIDKKELSRQKKSILRKGQDADSEASDHVDGAQSNSESDVETAHLLYTSPTTFVKQQRPIADDRLLAKQSQQARSQQRSTMPLSQQPLSQPSSQQQPPVF